MKDSNKKKPSDIICEDLQYKIIFDFLHPGDMIREVELAEQYKVSRTPVRQALQKLQSLGLVEIRDGSGTYVTQLDPDMIPYAYQIRNTMERLALKTSIRNIPDELLDAMEERFLRHKAELSKGLYGARFREIAEADWELHSAIIEYSDNPMIMAACEPSMLLLRRYQMVYTAMYSRATDEHIFIVRGIRNRDLKSVDAFLDDHLRRKPV